MHPALLMALVTASLFAAVILCIELGVQLGRYRARRSGGPTETGTGVVDAAVFGILGLLIAFTFGGAASRLDARRQLIGQEANIIGTAYLRLDVMPPEAQPQLRQMFRDYVAVRLRMHDNLLDADAQESYRFELSTLQGRIWSAAERACRQDQRQSVGLLLLPAINEMIDVTTTRSLAIMTHIPIVILAVLVIVSLVAAVLVGHAMSGRKARSVLHMVLFALVISASIYVILDLEYPRVGAIRLDAADQLLVQLRDSMK